MATDCSQNRAAGKSCTVQNRRNSPSHRQFSVQTPGVPNSRCKGSPKGPPPFAGVLCTQTGQQGHRPRKTLDVGTFLRVPKRYSLGLSCVYMAQQVTVVIDTSAPPDVFYRGLLPSSGALPLYVSQGVWVWVWVGLGAVDVVVECTRRVAAGAAVAWR